MIQPGIYQHYKGHYYKVFFVATHSETSEQHVTYQCLYGDYSYWIRPLSMFAETVVIEGVSQPRFKFIEAGDDLLDPRPKETHLS